ncbi:thioredoxin family protein [Catenulispora subtropica]
MLRPTGTTPFLAHSDAAGAAGRPVSSAAGKAGTPAHPTHRTVPPPARPAPAPPASLTSMASMASIASMAALGPDLAFGPQNLATTQVLNAVAAAQSDGKPVLLDFAAGSCAACKALENAMHTPKAQAFLAQHYHVVHVDLGDGDPSHLQIASPYDAYGAHGMPLLVVLGPDGSVRGDSAHAGQPRYDEAGVVAWLKQWVR